MTQYTFQAEIQQLLNILIHSLYTEREIFLRELISNASDALNRVQFEMLTNENVLDADAELRIDIAIDEEANTLTISDTGIGMTAEDMQNNLGVIARSGAKDFLEKMDKSENGTSAQDVIARSGAKDFIEEMDKSENGTSAQDVIGQFGVGFYSVFMVADKVRVVSRSYMPDGEAFAWESDGGDNYTIEPAERDKRGTDIIVHLKDDAKEIASSWKIKQIIRQHSDYIAFPIYVGEDEEPANKRTAIWRQDKNEVSEEQYEDFYKMLTMDYMGKPLHTIHMKADVPMQFYALLYIPSSAEPNMFNPNRDPGLKLYARKVLIQEANRDLLPEYLQFVQGVVDSEDLPLNVSRESVQANRVMANLKKTITSKVLSELKRMARKNTEDYLEIYHQFRHFIKQGVVVAPEDRSDVEQLLFFTSTYMDAPNEFWSLEDYVERMVENQDDIYYIIADDFHSARRSPHLDAFRERGIEVLYFSDPVDAAMLMGLQEFKGHKLRSVDEADIDLSNIGEAKDEAEEKPEPLAEAEFESLQQRFKSVLGERVKDVRESKTLSGSPARLVSEEGGATRNMFRINRLLDKEYELPVKTLELNPRHPLMHNLKNQLEQGGQDDLVNAVVEQVFETALLQDGIHPDPASMAERLTLLMQAATGTAAGALNFASAPRVEAPQTETFADAAGDVITGEAEPVKSED